MKQTKAKEIFYIDDNNKYNTRDFDIYEIFKNYLGKAIKYDDIDKIKNNIKKGIELYQKDRPMYTDKKNLL